ncbi:ribosomal RNA small subunit methyltransferase A [candidate division KSB1 bacterium]|nr:ribosomal RNA small subunit methyltransferase A [candidate division KSB1 bacterium]NIR68605.1 ribosomal RNA small subunit methyltransferase A [candidate division KSB1 bacterium]NIS25442.1 ribosomal RNA small subunit methyltransferase A [candidate division KSB1 bacterium]NIT72334.1 ribosomal RNA small subunit methyltransferase A [candidate division KSB1 bacterium]NIU26118.1 ribosomal RNA small subunit methyltransferase A [candidate division KSB1 bacterium]
MIDTTFRPKKSLGQNFLVDENIARKIIQALAPNPKDVVLEIGPGFGVLTKYLLPKVAKVIAVEIDTKLAEQLETEFPEFENFHLIQADFLKIHLDEWVETHTGRFRILGNIPYHITSPVIFKVLELRERIFDMTLMIQKEVAQRIVASPGTKDYGILSVVSQLYSEPDILFNVSRNVFRPKPEVASSVVRWLFSKKAFQIENEDVLDELIHGAFQQRRKMLRKSLKSIPEFAKKLNDVDFELEKRPEQLSPEEFVSLSNLLS